MFNYFKQQWREVQIVRKKGGVRGQKWFWAGVEVKWQMAAVGNRIALKESKA